MDRFTERLATLTPEKRLLLELLKKQKNARPAPEQEEPPQPPAGTPPGGSAPFSLISEDDRRRLPEGVEDAYPLTMIQLGMLSHMDLRPDAPTPPAYHNVNSFHLRSPFDFAAFEEAVNSVVARHAILRTSFDLVTYSRPMQLVHRTARMSVGLADLRGLPAPEQASVLRDFINGENYNLFDLSRPPLLRFFVHRLTDETFQLTLTEPHAVSDGWSTNLTLAEMCEHYYARLNLQPPPDAPPPPVAFRDFVRLEQEALESEECRRFWDEKLDGAEMTRLPRRPRPPAAAQTIEDHKLDFSLNIQLTEALHRVARQAGVPLKSVLFAAHLKAMSVLSGRSDVLTGMVFNGRPEVPGGDEVRGLFLNTLPVRCRVRRGTWLDLARQAYEAELEVMPHRRYPLPALQARRGNLPLFETAFSYLHFHSLEQTLGKVEDLGAGGSDLSVTNFPFKATFQRSVLASSRLELSFEFDLDEFDREHVRSFYGYYERALAAMTADPLARHDAAWLLAPRERQLLSESNETAAVFPPREGVHRLFEEWAAATPDAPALMFEGARLGYGELNKRANQLARALRKLGVGPDVRVGLHMERTPELVVGLLGVLKAGGAYVPLDPALPLERLAFMAEEARAALVLTHGRHRESAPRGAWGVLDLDADWADIAREGDENLAAEVSPANLVYVIFTSGSTGRPKGVGVEHRQLLNYVRAVARVLELPPGASYAMLSTFAADLGNTTLFPSLCGGGCLHVIGHERASDPEAVAEYFERHAIDCLKIVPSHLAALLSVERPRRVLPRARLVLGGEACHRWLLERVGELAPECRVVNHYGPTETTVGALTFGARDADDLRHAATVPIGLPLANAQAYLLDEDAQPAPVNTPGELYVGGAGVARGYLGRPAQTAERFVPDPFSREPGARLYRTGDVARRLPSGRVEFLGRRDEQVKIRGFRVEPGEVDAALSRHPQVRASVTLVRADAQGENRLVSYVVCDAGGAADAAALRDFLKEKLPEYMLPASFVGLPHLPLTPNGKVDRRALPPPEEEAQARAQDFIAPRTPVEEMVAGICARVLGRESVGAFDDFFDLGGHSLLAFQLIARLREAFRADLHVRAIFETPTVAEMARHIESRLRAGGRTLPPPLVRVGRDSRGLPLSFAQQRLWFLDQLQPGTATYNIPSAVRVEGRLDARALRRSLDEVVRRHEALRTTFAVADGEPRQFVADEAAASFTLVDLRGLPAGERERESRRLADEEARRPFDLARGPLLRAALVRLADEEHVLLFTMHHIISDAWSSGVLVGELAELYESFAGGREPSLPDLPVQYGDFAAWQREWLGGEVLREQLDYWVKQLAGAPTAVELPADYPRPALQTFRGAVRHLTLPGPLTEKLNELSRREGVTLFMTLLAAFQTLLHRYTGQTDILVGTPVAGRSSTEVERLIGVFINTLVLRADLSGDPTFREVLKRVREAALGAYAHQDMPFEKLVEELQPERDLSRSPLFQVMFVLQPAANAVLDKGGLRLSAVESERGAAKFDLTLSLTETPAGLTGSLEYNTDLFAEATIARLAGHFTTLLEAVTADAGRRVASLPLLTADEARRQLVEWNRTRRDYPRSPFIHELFEEQARRTPEAVALVFGRERLTYGELNARANRLAHHLRSCGVGPEVLVGVMADRSLELVVALLGVLKAGGAYVPLDPDYPAQRLAYMLGDSRVALVLTQEEVMRRLPAPLPVRTLRLDADWDTLPSRDEENPPRALSGDNLAYVIYTSGSTGEPKGAANTHGAALNRLLWMQEEFRLDESDAVLQKTPSSFDVSVWEFFWPLLAGARLVIAAPGGHRDAAYLAELMGREGVTTVHFVPSMLSAFLAEEGAVERCGSLRRVVCSGEALSAELAERFHARSPAGLYNLYGPTEAAVDVTWWRCERGAGRRSVPIGRPIANTEIHILDPWGGPTPVGVGGELYIGGVALARGYWGRPELTAERFVPHPYSEEPGARLYRTGDLARRLEGGEIEYLGRTDSQVKVRGFRIELGEVEAALRGREGVREAAAVVREVAGGDRRLVAYVVLSEGAGDVTAEEWREGLSELLPEYMIPSAFVRLDALPLTPSGKLDRRALPTPDNLRPKLAQAYVAPQTEVEQTIADIWQEALGVERVGVHDNFFDLGGHSLLMVRVLGSLRERLGATLSIVELFQHPTVSALAASLQRVGRGDEEDAAEGVRERARRQRERMERDRLRARGRSENR